MSTPSYTKNYERVRRLVARRDYRCWSWAERCSPPGDTFDPKHPEWAADRPCTRVIGEGETYVESTVFAGHESMDGAVRRDPQTGLWVPDKRPRSNRFCVPCSWRWVNICERLLLLDGHEDGAA